MPTIRQKRLAQIIVEESGKKIPKYGGEMLEAVGYSHKTAIGKPGEIIGGIGVKVALNELGFSEEGAKKVVADILYNKKAKDRDRLDAADKVFKVHGTYASDHNKNGNRTEVNVNVNSDDAKIAILARQIDEFIIERSKSKYNGTRKDDSGGSEGGGEADHPRLD